MVTFSRCKRSNGFNLIDLLVCIAITAILISILFPILTHSKKQSLKAKCMSNMRQLGKAFHGYLEDWESRWPCPGGLKGDHSYWAVSGSGGLVPYVQSNGGLRTIWCCPYLKEWYGEYPPRSYSMNSYMRDPMDWEWIDAEGIPLGIKITRGIHDTQIMVPSRTILLYEGIPETKIYYVVGGQEEKLDHIDRCGNWTQVKGWFPDNAPKPHSIRSNEPWHGKMNNYIYADGHAATFAPHKYPNAPPRDCTNEWYVQKFRNVPKGQGV